MVDNGAREDANLALAQAIRNAAFSGIHPRGAQWMSPSIKERRFAIADQKKRRFQTAAP
jgi:hypothetical protein